MDGPRPVTTADAEKRRQPCLPVIVGDTSRMVRSVIAQELGVLAIQVRDVTVC